MLSMLSMFNSRPARPKGFPHGIFLPAAVLLLLLVLVSATAPAASAEWANRPLVETRQGWLKGMADKQATWCWKGVPYAAPPVGDLRWKAPLDPAPWKGVRQARKFKSPASQTLPWIGEIGSEDCLYLNVWRPRNSSVGLPVYVFIHGGGNSIGTGTARDYSGCAVAGRSGMVYVTINFRLGVFGWFRHPAVTDAGSDEDRSGNFGTLDLIKALRWIRENIESFGGDPGNVTITGESGGAMDVLSLLTTPQASGLFHRAVVQSGLALTRSTAEAWQGASSLLLNILVADGKAKDLNEAARLSGTMSREEISAIFRAASPSSLMKSIPTIVGGMADWPMLLTDGTVIPAEGFGVFEKGSWANKVPLVIGVNRDEMKLFRFLLKNPEPGSRSYEILSRFQSLAWRVNGLDNIALAMTSHPDAPPVYAYRFDWGSADENGVSVLPGKLGSLLGANHYAEIPFFLGNGTNQLSILTGKSYTSANKPGREKLTTVTLNYLANFARTGNPNGDQLPYWDAWSSAPGRNKLIILDAGLKDLKISFSSEVITMKRIRETVISEFNEPERSWILRHLEGAAIFKQAAQ
jgi:para-nitrobenzyl esterase